MRHFAASGRALAVLLALTACEGLPGFPGRAATAGNKPEPVTAGPWLLDPQAGSITVAWLTEKPSAGRVWYGTTAPDRLATEAGPATVEHRLTLASLPMQTQLRYRVEGAGEEFVFTTAPEAGSDNPFTVLVYGDNRSNNGDHALVARAAASEHAQLALHTGDMVVNATEDDLWRVWFREEHDLLATTPFVPTMGNHEITDTGVAYSKYFKHKDRPAYWSLDYGPVHLAVLDSFETAAGATPHSSGVSEAQKAWLEEDLRRVPRDRHVWILVHQGPYSHPERPRPGHGGSDPVRQAILAARKIHPVEVVFAGHEHYYERGEIDGLKYFVLGGGGAPLDEPDPTFPGVFSAQKALSYATVEVCGCHVRGKVKDIAGAVIDAFELASCAAPCGAAGAVAPVSVATPALALAPFTEASDGGTDGGRRRGKRRRAAEDGGAVEASDAGSAEGASAGPPDAAVVESSGR